MSRATSRPISATRYVSRGRTPDGDWRCTPPRRRTPRSSAACAPADRHGRSQKSSALPVRRSCCGRLQCGAVESADEAPDRQRTGRAGARRLDRQFPAELAGRNVSRHTGAAARIAPGAGQAVATSGQSRAAHGHRIGSDALAADCRESPVPAALTPPTPVPRLPAPW